MQPSNNCLVFLTGSGGEHDHLQVMNMNFCDYKVVFPIPLKDSLTDAHHNLLLKIFSLDAPQGYRILSDLPTTYTAHKDNIPAQTTSINLAVQHCQYVHEHYLTAVKNTNDALSLDKIAPEQYKAYPLHSSENWSGHIEVILDQGQLLRDLNHMLKSEDYQYDGKNFQVKLSSENCLQIRILEKKSFNKLGNSLFGSPFDKTGISLFENPFDQVVISLSKFLDSIIPNIRIPFVYHADSKMIEIIPNLYLNDGGVSFRPEKICQDFVGMFKKATDFYYEAVIPSNAYVIWDGSRSEIKFKLFDSRSNCQHQSGLFKNYI